MKILMKTKQAFDMRQGIAEFLSQEGNQHRFSLQGISQPAHKRKKNIWGLAASPSTSIVLLPVLDASRSLHHPAAGTELYSLQLVISLACPTLSQPGQELWYKRGWIGWNNPPDLKLYKIIEALQTPVNSGVHQQLCSETGLPDFALVLQSQFYWLWPVAVCVWYSDPVLNSFRENL